MNKTKAQRRAEADLKFEQAAATDKYTPEGREKAARLISEGNAIKMGRPAPKHAKTT